MAADHRAQAGKIWPILVEVATAKGKMTYGELGPRVGVFYRNLNLPLDLIARHCKRNGLPPLTVVIVNADTDEPGPGFLDGDDVAGAFTKVYEHDWAAVKNPFALFLTT